MPPTQAIADRFRPDRQDWASPPPQGQSIHVTSGAQQGASHRLHDGHCTIGNSMDCDLVLHIGGEPQRVLLSVQDGLTRVTALAGSIRLGDTLLRVGSSADWRVAQILMLGKVTLALSEDEALPGMAEDDPPASGSPVPPGGQGLPPRARSWSHPRALPVQAKPRRPWQLALALLLSVIGLLGITTFLNWPEPAPPERPRAATPQAARTDLQVWLTQQGHNGLSVNAAAAGPEVSGYVPDEASLRQLRAQLLAAGFKANLDVHAQSTVAASADQLLNSQPWGGRHRYAGEGVMQLEGDWRTLDKARVVAVNLLHDVPGLRRVDVKSSGKVPSHLSAVRTRDGIRLNEEWVLPLEAVFNGRHQLMMTQTSPQPMLVLANGRRIFEGGQLDDKWRLEHIAEHSLLLTEAGVPKRVLLP